MRQFEAKIASNQKIAPDHFVLLFSATKIAKETKPGQFFNIRINNSYQPLLRRPFGAYKIHKDRIEILYKVVGKATKILSKKKKGEILDVIGPLGNGFEITKPKKDRQESAILVAGGHGVAPLVGLAEQLSAIGSQLSVFIGARAKNHVVCEKDFLKLGAKVYIATEDGMVGHKGLVTDLLKKRLRSAIHDPRVTIFACGPKPMLKAVAKIAKECKIPCKASLEEYVACGTGTCLGCAVKTRSGYKLICKDGPVFDTKEIIWRT